MISGAIFDVDGTLLDSMSVWDTVADDYLRSLGIIPRENLAETFKTFSMQQSAAYMQRVYGVEKTEEEITAGVSRIIEDFYRYHAPLKEGAAGFLHKLRDGGVKLSVATATDRKLVEAALSRCGVLELFSGFFTCGEVGHSKNEPDIFRAAQAFMGTAREETWVFEDAFHAAATAGADGFPVAAVWDSHEEKQEELKAMADRYLISFLNVRTEDF